MSEFAGDLPNRRRSKMDKIVVNAFIHGGALSDPSEQYPNYSGKKNQRDIDRLIKILEWYVTKPTGYPYFNMDLQES